MSRRDYREGLAEEGSAAKISRGCSRGTLQRKIVSNQLMTDLQQQFGQIDIYLFDQLLRGRIAPGMRILDAGCGHGRNLVYLLREGYEVFGADADPRAIDAVRQIGSIAGAWPSAGQLSRGGRRSHVLPGRLR